MSTHPDYGWLHFVRRSSERGARFADEFQRMTRPHPDLGFRAVALFQGHRLDEGLAALADYKQLICDDEAARGPMRQVLLRYYYAALAYYHYCRDDYDEALQCLDRAQRCLEEAIHEQHFIIGLATSCEEFCLHKARVARNLRRWRDMRRHVEAARRMNEGVAPLCTLPNGRDIKFPDVKDFYLSIPDLTPAELASLRHVTDVDYRLSQFELFVERMYVLPGFVILF